ncbi:MAG: V-type ATP synthase subunit D [Actinobacteria bacterium]|nr:V-type ATP synthase subunit D [Actinomycetota bacterium]
MEEIHVTRMELLEKKKQIVLAEQGADLLKKKRDALLIEFMSVMDLALQTSEELQRAAREATYAISIARAVDGTVALKAAGLAVEKRPFVEITGSYVMGIPIPEINKVSVRRSVLGREWSMLGVSSRIDETAEKMENEVDIIVEVAGVETKLKRLAAEIQKTRRRVNALDYIVVPRLKEQVKFISQSLEERAREDIFRLKKVKKSLEKRKKERTTKK